MLADRDNLNYLTPLAQIVAGAVSPLDGVLEAFRSGGGVPFAAYGRDLRDGQARMNRVAFLQLLGREWLPSIPDVHHRLESDPPAQVADIGCGAGWSSIGIAKSYTRVKVDGFDLDEPSVEAARGNAWVSGAAKRVTFEARYAGDPELADNDLRFT